MEKQLAILKRVGLFGFAFLMLATVFFPILQNKAFAQGAPTGEFIDRHLIRIMRGDNETIFRDVNPYDDERGYEGGPASCEHDLDVENWDEGRVSIQFKDRDSTGACEDDGSRVDITLGNLGMRNINAYRLNADTIFTPVTLSRDNPRCDADTTFTGTEVGEFINQSDPESGNWERKPPDERDGHQNRYYRDDGSFLYDKMRIETTGAGGDGYRHGKFVITFDSCTGFGDETHDYADGNDFSSIWITENPLPPEYDDDGDGSPDGVGGGGDGDDDGLPSCEEANPGISLSWFICSVINFLDNTIAGLNNAVQQMLQIDKSYYTDDGLRQSWAYFRNIASFLLILIGLVMIIGQAMTKG